MKDTDKYFLLLERIRIALSQRQYEQVLVLCRQSLPLVPGLIVEWTRDYGAFDISSVPSLELGARFASAKGEVEWLRELRQWVASVPQLVPWVTTLDDRIAAAECQRRLLSLLRDQPGLLQSTLPKILGAPGRLTSLETVQVFPSSGRTGGQ